MLCIWDVFSLFWSLAQRLAAVQLRGIDITEAQEVGGCRVDFKNLGLNYHLSSRKSYSHIPTPLLEWEKLNMSDETTEPKSKSQVTANQGCKGSWDQVTCAVPNFPLTD